MNTERLTVDPNDPEPRIIAEAARVIRRGGLVAFPTETVYGLGANALDAEAVAKIFAAKGRALDDPCIVHLADLADLARVTPAPIERVAGVARRFWPGPLSIILPRGEAIPAIVTAGRPTVAVRLPAHPVALALIRAAGVPIAAPSANLFTHTSPTTADHVWVDLAGRIDILLDGGPAAVGVESTVLDLTGAVPRVLRPGGVGLEALRAELGDVLAPGEASATETGASPGLMPKHYAPHADLWLFVGPAERVRVAMADRARELAAAGRRVGLLVADEDADALAVVGAPIQSVGPASDLEMVGRRLYAAMRALEARDVEVILARGYPEAGLGLAIQDRLTRAAGRVIRV